MTYPLDSRAIGFAEVGVCVLSEPSDAFVETLVVGEAVEELLAEVGFGEVSVFDSSTGRAKPNIEAN